MLAQDGHFCFFRALACCFSHNCASVFYQRRKNYRAKINFMEKRFYLDTKSTCLDLEVAGSKVPFDLRILPAR